jgi:hypothetical protein
MKKLIVILAVIAMVGAFTATAMADVELYGSARFRTYYTDTDPGTGVESDSDLEWRMGTLSRFGANFKSDKITGKFELDARAAQFKNDPNTNLVGWGTQDVQNGTGASSMGNMRLRHLWGQYDFGAGKLMIGQNYPLYDAPVSGINYYAGGFQPLGGIGYGVARTAQIRLTFGNLKIAFLPTDTSRSNQFVEYEHLLANDYVVSKDPDNTITDTDVSLPKIELRYDMKMDAVALNFIAGYQTYDSKGTVNGAAFDDSIDSYVLGARGKFNFGAAYLGASITYRQNGANYGAWTSSAFESPTVEGGSVKDGTAWGAVAALGYKINDMFTVEGSYGMLSSELDTNATNEDDSQTYGLLAKITLAPGVYVIPEFIFQDNKDITRNGGASVDQGDKTIFGVFWMINFK